MKYYVEFRTNTKVAVTARIISEDTSATAENVNKHAVWITTSLPPDRLMELGAISVKHYPNPSSPVIVSEGRGRRISKGPMGLPVFGPVTTPGGKPEWLWPVVVAVVSAVVVAIILTIVL